MSFNVSKKGAAGEVVNALHADTSVPDGVKAFVLAGVNALQLGDRHVKVSAYGHLHDGTAGNSEESTATIMIAPCEAEQPVAEKSDAKVAAGEQAKEA